MYYVILIGLAVVFYRIGEYEYQTGWVLVGASILLSLAGLYFFSIIGMVTANVLLFVGMTVYNMVTKKPPGSSSGF